MDKILINALSLELLSSSMLEMPIDTELLPATPLELPNQQAQAHIARLKIGCIAVLASFANGPVVIRPTLHPGGALQSLRLSHDNKKGRLPVLAGCIWCADIKQAHHLAELVSVCDLRESKRVGGDAIAVSVVDAVRAIGDAAKRLQMTIVPHEVLLARVRSEIKR